jgi:hypothetical protein
MHYIAPIERGRFGEMHTQHVNIRYVWVREREWMQHIKGFAVTDRRTLCLPSVTHGSLVDML